MNEPIKEALPLLKKIEAAGFEAYIVGGSIRDYVLNRETADVDIATSAFPEEIKTIFSHTVDVGIEHGTVLVVENGKGFEITTFRTESAYVDFRRPASVTFVRDLHEDLKRRDFTMNSMAMDIHGTIHDPFFGKEDLSKKVIRTVGEAEERFTEDALRMLRAVRFVSQLGFSLEKQTACALTSCAPLLQHIAQERITMEINKLFSGEHKKQALETILSSNMFQYIQPLTSLAVVLKALVRLPIHSLSVNQMWILMTYLVENDINHFLKQWKLPAKKINYYKRTASFLLERQSLKWDAVTIYETGLQTAQDIQAVYQTLHPEIEENQITLEKLFASLPIKHRKELQFTGIDVLQLFEKKGGPWVKELLARIETEVIEKRLDNSKGEIEAWVIKNYIQENN